MRSQKQRLMSPLRNYKLVSGNTSDRETYTVDEVEETLLELLVVSFLSW